MGLKDVLAKLNLVELEATAAPARPAPAAPKPSKGPPPTPPPAPARKASRESIQEMLASMPKAEPVDERSLPEPGASGELADFEAVYRAAGVTPPAHGFTALKVLEILASQQLSGLDGRAKAAALAAFLQAHPGGAVSLRDIVEDAVRRDEALDAYETALMARLRARAEQVERQNAQLQAEIDAIARRNQQLITDNLAALEAEQSRVRQWQAGKRIEEKRLFDAVAPFVETNPVSMGGVEPHPSS